MLKHLKLYESFSIINNHSFWKKIDEWVSSYLKNPRTSNPAHLLLNDDSFFSKKRKSRIERIEDDIFANLSNKGIVMQGLNEQERLYFLLLHINHLNNSLKNSGQHEIKVFSEWYNNSKITIYRGDSLKKQYTGKKWISKSIKMEHDAYSFWTLDEEEAIKYTQPGWNMFAFRDENHRNGYLLKAQISAKDIYLFNPEAGEDEIIPFKKVIADEIIYVKDGKIVHDEELNLAK